MPFTSAHWISRHVRWSFFSACAGIMAGVATTIFLMLLELATQTREQHPIIIWLLPFSGLLIGWVYYRYGKQSVKGNNLILEELHQPQKVVPLQMASLVLGGTVLTHLFGGSAGRESTAVQMGSTLADRLSVWFRISREDRRILLAAGASAGFSAAIGAPLAGAIFGMEFIHIGRLRLFAWFECLIAAVIAYFTTHLMHAPHTIYPQIALPTPELLNLICVLAAGIVFGLAARTFTMMAHAVDSLQLRLIKAPPLRPLVGGFILLIFFWLEGSYRYAGLGIPVIQTALTQTATFIDPLLKAVFTALTVGSGFKGGEFIPLVFIGTTLGSALSQVLPVSFQLLGGVGFAAVFAGASNTPLACSLMAMELFGPQIGPFALIACFASYYSSGMHGIYKAQRNTLDRRSKFGLTWLWFEERLQDLRGKKTE